MDLWIRSQDKEVLTRVDYLDIRESGSLYAIATQVHSNTKVLALGIYKTKERALEILDGIQNMNDIDTRYENTDLEMMVKIYEMPKE